MQRTVAPILALLAAGATCTAGSLSPPPPSLLPVPLIGENFKCSCAAQQQGHDLEAATEQLLHTVLEIIGGGLSAAERLVDAQRNETWASQHAEAIGSAVHSLQQAWATVQKEVDAWQRMTEHRDDTKPEHINPSYLGILQPLLLLGLVCAAVVMMRGRRPFDLFSQDVHSRSEVALAFTIASLVSLSLANGWRVQLLANNPFALYVVQLAMCFMSTTATIPLVRGTYRKTPRCVVFASLGVLIWFLVLWLTTNVSIVPKLTRGDQAMAVMMTLLSLALLLVSSKKVAYALGARKSYTEPFYERHERDCAKYLQARLRGCSEGIVSPVHSPAALLVAVFSAGSFVFATLWTLAHWAATNSAALHRWVLDYLMPLQPLFTWAGDPLRPEDMDIAIGRSLACFLFGLTAAAIYVAWLLRTVVYGYKRIFRALMCAKEYQGDSLVRQYGPVVFHPQWGTYFAGALVGNCMMAFAVVGSLVFLITFLLSLSQFWAILWATRDWFIFYGLLYSTRYCIFRWVVPVYVVTSCGAVLRRRVWALLFPTLMLLNFVVGATSGVIRFFVMLPFMVVQFFRVDMTFLPQGYEDWDWSFHPFLSFVTHAHTRLNPVVCAVVTELARSCSSGLPSQDGGGDDSPTTPLPGGSAHEAASATLGEPLARSDDLVEVEIGPSSACIRNRARERARSRWYLALTLARNPSLAKLRWHALAEPVQTTSSRSSVIGRLVAAEGLH